jgi:hypothetical protein
LERRLLVQPAEVISGAYLALGEELANLLGFRLRLANRPAVAEFLRVHHLDKPPQNYFLAFRGRSDRINADPGRLDDTGIYPG